MSWIRWPGPTSRSLLMIPANEPSVREAQWEHAWHLEDIRSGLPQVYPATHELFVAQMLNVDLLEGISFEKGCYTGQEIIARTHFRGTVKRRMFRFRANCAPPAPATRVIAQGSHAGEVVDAVATPQGCELLAVVSLAQRSEKLTLAEIADSGLELLELPYAAGD